MSAVILHVDMDAFFASIEQQVNPALRGKPVIIGGRNNPARSIICAASYEAKARGVSNAMPSWQAFQICPDAVFVPADTPKYIYTSNRIFALLKGYCAQVEKFSVDEFFLDLAGCPAGQDGPAKVGRAIKDDIKAMFGITCSVGVAPTRITAKLAAKSRKPDGLVIWDREDVLNVMKDLPVDKICGIGRRLKRRFNRLGIETCGQLAVYPGELLREHFGVVGLWLKAACRVEDVADIGETAADPAPPKSVGHSQTLRETTDDEEYIRDWIYLLSEMVAARLRRKGLQGRTVYFYISDGFHGGFAKRRTFAAATYDGYEIYQRCLRILRMMRVVRPVARVLGVSVSQLSALDNQYLYASLQRRDRLLRTLDDINNRFGEWTVFPAGLRRAVY